ncbi:glycosyltransferase [uncultured Winogradskyella sp.]|uniref:glycosyltransferase n=1 Tax=uncultured Winogradskyella sp. TaxID=395353 RepID=UPI003515641A
MSPNKKNITILSITLGSGGAEKVISLLLKELKKDYNVTLVIFYRDIHFPIPEDVNLKVFSSSKSIRPFLLKVYDSVRFVFKYLRFVRKNNIDISISFLAFPNLINGFVSMFNSHVKTIISERGYPSDNTTSKTSHLISKVFYPILYNKCDKLFSNSIHINNDLKDNFGVRIPMEVIYNPIEMPDKTVESSLLTKVTDKLEIITAGSLIIRKNQIMVIRAIKESNLNYNFLILGGGELENYLNDQISTLDLVDSVTLKGVVKDVNSYFVKSQCFILSSFTEGFPNALLEAMASGLPCISTNCLSGPLELLNENEPISIENGDFYVGKYGVLVNNDDHIGLSKALDYLHNNPQERERFSQLSLKRSKTYSLEQVYAKFKHFIQD